MRPSAVDAADSASSVTSSVLLDPSSQLQSTDPSAASRSLTWFVWSARALLFGQLIWLLLFSTVEYRRGALTFDFANWEQARWLISHGHINPYDSVEGMPFWQLNGNWLMWPLAEFSRLPPHGLWLLWFQDLAVFGCGWVAVNWVRDALSTTGHFAIRGGLSRPTALSAEAGVLLVALLIVANPWVYRSVAFDFHWEEPAAFFVILTAWDLARGRNRRFWTWAVLAMATADLSALYIAGVGLGGLLAGRSVSRRSSAALVAAGLLWVAVMGAIHANKGSILTEAYAYLAGPHAVNPSVGSIAKGAVFHPSRPLSEIWSNRLDIWANLAPSGLIGVFNPWGFGAAVSVLLPSLLWPDHAFAQPSFQNFAAYPVVALGGVLLLVRLSARHVWMRWMALAGGAAMSVLALGWAWNWLPSYPSQWLAVTPAGGTALSEARSLIPERSEVVASNGVAGRFADRDEFFMPMAFPYRIPLRSTAVYFVLSLDQGVPYATSDTRGLLYQVSQMGAQELMNRAGVRVFRWEPPAGVRSLVLQGAQGGLAAWTLNSSVGRAVTDGPPLGWRIEDVGEAGLVVWGDYWSLAPGTYTAKIDLATNGQTTVQVYEPESGATVATKTVTGDGGGQSVEIPFTITRPRMQPGTRGGVLGRAPFDYQSWPSPPGTTAEVRVNADTGGINVNVYAVAVRASS